MPGNVVDCALESTLNLISNGVVMASKGAVVRDYALVEIEAVVDVETVSSSPTWSDLAEVDYRAKAGL